MPERLLGFSLIIGSWSVGALIVRFTPVPLPASIVGLVLLAGGLFSGLIRLNWVEAAAQTMLRHMVLFFIPTIVGIINYGEVLRAEFAMLTTSLVLPWLGVLVSTAVMSRILLRKADHEVDTGSEA